MSFPLPALHFQLEAPTVTARPCAYTWFGCGGQRRPSCLHTFHHPKRPQNRTPCTAWQSQSWSHRQTVVRRKTKCHALSEAEEASLRQATKYAVDSFVPSNSVIGLGQGTTIAYALEYIAEQLQQGHLKNVSVLPGSDVASVEAAVHGIPVQDIAGEAQADVTLLEADELDCSGSDLALITGRASEDLAQQPQLDQLRSLLQKSKQCLVLAAGPHMIARRLSGALPVLVEGAHWEDVAEELDDIFLPAAEIWRRPTEGVANPRGGKNPYTSRDGHHILDIRFNGILKLYGEVASYGEIAEEIETVHGVIAHGLIYGIAGRAVIAQPGGPRVIEKVECT